MQDWSIPLVVAVSAFLAVLLWRVRPHVPWGEARRDSREKMREARRRIEQTESDQARATALCDAGEIAAASKLGGGSAIGFFLRALRTDPSAEVIERMSRALAGRPRRLESLLWRHLASGPWTDTRAVRASVDALRSLYEGPLKSATRQLRARALANAADALAGGSTPAAKTP